MKKLLAPIVLSLVSGILLSSCNNTSNLSITKRHYRSGYYVDLGGRQRTHVATMANKPLKRDVEPIATIETKQVNYVASKPTASIAYAKMNVVQKVLAPKIMLAPKNKEISSVSLNQTTISESADALVSIPTMASGVNTVQHEMDHTKNDAIALALIIIITIFIPPLGVGLMYGLDDYFWIDLLLTILFFLPGLIFGLVVVLS